MPGAKEKPMHSTPDVHNCMYKAVNKSSRQAPALFFSSSLTTCLRRVPSRHCA